MLGAASVEPAQLGTASFEGHPACRAVTEVHAVRYCSVSSCGCAASRSLRPVCLRTSCGTDEAELRQSRDVGRDPHNYRPLVLPASR
jgi:hypothetical protein